MSIAIDDILAERRRQIEIEGFDPATDDKYVNGELGRAGGIYALIAGSDATNYRNARDGYSLGDYLEAMMTYYWPWSRKWFKVTTRRRDLVKAGACIVAEIERLDRLSSRADK